MNHRALTQLLLIFSVVWFVGCNHDDDDDDPVVDNTPGQSSNNPPTVNAGADQTVDENTLVSFSAIGSDAEGAVTFSWAQTAGSPSVSLQNAGSANASFTAPDVATNTTLTFTLTVTDTDGATAEDSINVTVTDIDAPIDNPPTANAGPDQSVNPGDRVDLSGSGLDAEGSVTYLWQQTAGTAVTLSDETSPTPTFTAPSVASTEVLAFELSVTDEALQTTTDMVNITVSPGATSVSFNRRISEMYYDFDNNGVDEGTQIFNYNPDGSLESITYTYVDDGTPDADIASYGFSIGAGDEDADITVTYYPDGQVEVYYLQTESFGSEVTYFWHANRTIEYIENRSYNGSGGLVSSATHQATYTGGLLSYWEGIRNGETDPYLSMDLTYDGTGVLEQTLRTNAISSLQLESTFDWSPEGRIDLITRENPASDYQELWDYVYVGGLNTEEIINIDGLLYSFNHSFNGESLRNLREIDLDDDGSIEASVSIVWEEASCKELILWEPTGHPSPTKTLADDYPFALGDGHVFYFNCANAP